jgi:hypothetical protein
MNRDLAVYGLSDLIVDDVIPARFGVRDRASGPINRYFETPVFEHPRFVRDGPTAAATALTSSLMPRSVYAAERARLWQRGYRGGYVKAWATPVFEHHQEAIWIAMYEFASSDGAASWSQCVLGTDTVRSHRMYADDDDPRWPGATALTVWDVVGSIGCQIDALVDLPRRDAEVFALELADAQLARLQELVPQLPG